MGQGAEDAMAAYAVIEARGIDPEVYYGRKPGPRFTSKKKARKGKARKTIEHHPADDATAKALIESLGCFKWNTHKVSGAFSHNPYSLTATIDGTPHVIFLAGRFGGVLKWLAKHDTASYKEGARS